MSEPVTLRKATERDVPAILALIRGIAEYERLSHEVQATEALLREHGFGPPGGGPAENGHYVDYPPRRTRCGRRSTPPRPAGPWRRQVPDARRRAR